VQKNDNSHNNNPGSNAVNYEDSVRIGERTFRKTKIGLVEDEVRAYVEEIIAQRDALVKRQEHLAALTELAEKTVMDASNLSQSMMKKATDQAKAEADKIKMEADRIKIKAEQDGEQIIKQKRTEAKTAADKEAETIKADAVRQAKIIRDDSLENVRAEAAALAQKLQNELIVSIENVKKHAVIIGAGAPAGGASPRPAMSSSAPHAPAMDAPTQESAASADKQANIPWLEVEVLPPLDIEKIMNLISHLDALPEVQTTDLLPETPNPLIRVFLKYPAPLAAMLRVLPQIEKVNETSETLEDGSKRERIQIVLGKNGAKNQDTKKGNK
jgi:cell division septum initiation protein DivIVA